MIEIGRGYSEIKFIKERFKPYVHVLEYSNIEKLLEILINVLPIMEKQLRICRHIQEKI